MPPTLTHTPQPLSLDREKLRIMVYGEFGRGKTTLAGTFPKPLFIDTNGALISLAVAGAEASTFEPNGHNDLEGLYYWIKEHSADYDTIVIDTLDTLVYLLMDEISDDANSFKKRDGKQVSLRMQFVPEQGDYYANQPADEQVPVCAAPAGQARRHHVLAPGHRQRAAHGAERVAWHGAGGLRLGVRDWGVDHSSMRSPTPRRRSTPTCSLAAGCS